MAGALGYLGNVATAQGRFDQAWLFYRESMELRRRLDDTWGVAASLNNLGLLAHHEGNWEAAGRFFAESLALRRTLNDRRCLAITLNLMGLCACEQGDVQKAREHLAESLELCLSVGDRRSIAYSLEAFATLGVLEEQPERALLLLGAASRLRAEIASPLPPSEQGADTARKLLLYDLLGAERYAQVWQEGHTLSLDDVIAWYVQGSPFRSLPPIG